MKTNFKNIAAASALAFAGVFSANASGNNSVLVSSNENTTETIDYRKEAQLITRWFVDRTEAKVTQEIMERRFAVPAETTASVENEIENTFEVIDFRAEAQLMTRETADREEAKATQEVMDKGWVAPNEENNYEETDFRTEAQLITRLIADQEEVKALRKLVTEGKIAETK